MAGVGEMAIGGTVVETGVQTIARSSNSLTDDIQNFKESGSSTNLSNEVDDILKDKKLTNQTNKVDNYESPIKGYDQAKKDFDKLNLKNIREYPNGTIAGDLSDGITVNVRNNSSKGFPTLEIQGADSIRTIKIRY